MIDIPLFPLNTVLFPGMPLKLHIFEERYKTMVNECLENDMPFGVVLIQSGVEAMGPLAKPHMIGCTAQISQVKRLAFGRMNIVAVGQSRFRIHTLNYDQPYLKGTVELLQLDDSSLTTANKSLRLMPLLKRYLETLESAGQVQFDFTQLPNDPMSIAYLAAVLLQTESDQKQSLLAEDDSTKLLDTLLQTYRREVTILEKLVTPPETISDSGPFSPN